MPFEPHEIDAPRLDRNPSQNRSATGRAISLRLHWPWLLIVVVPVLIYAQCWNFELLEWDDPPHILRNPYLMPLSWAGLSRLWQRSYFGVYIPVFYTFLAGETWLAQRVGGIGSPYPGIYHAGSVLLHVANAALVFVILRRIVRQEVPAALGALLFAVHPLQVESVAWVSETRGLLAALFGLASVWFYLEWIEPHSPASANEMGNATGSATQSNPWFYAGSLVAFLLALLSKPSAVAIPLLLILAEGCLRRRWLRTLYHLAPWFGLALLLTIITQHEQQGEITIGTSPWMRMRIAGDALAFYLYKFFCPVYLATDYGRTVQWVVNRAWTWLTALVPLVVALLLAWRRQWFLFLALAIFVAVLLPVLGLLPFAFQKISTVADRYAYLALLGPAFALAWWMALKQSRPRLIGTGVILLVLALMSYVQAGYWRDDWRLFSHNLEVNPRSYIAEDKLGMALHKRGNPAAAVDHFLAAERLNPEFAAAYNNAGTVLLELKRGAEAAEQLSTAAHLRPDDGRIQFGLGQAYLLQNQHAQAGNCFATAIRLDPRFTPARLALASELIRRAELDKALQELNQALELEPDNVAALYKKGQILADQNKLMGAETFFGAALDLDPQNGEIRESLSRIRARRRSGG